MIFKDITKEDNERILNAFVRDPSVVNYKGEHPRRATYIRKAEPSRIQGAIKNGARINECTTAHWDRNVNMRFEQAEEDWIFRFDRIVGEYFSFSWALNAAEIERLNPRTQISVSINRLQTATGKPIKAETFGRLHYVKGTTHEISEEHGSFIDGRYVVGFSLNDEKRQYNQAYRIWLDFLILAPKSHSILIGEPLLVFQDCISLF